MRAEVLRDNLPGAGLQGGTLPQIDEAGLVFSATPPGRLSTKGNKSFLLRAACTLRGATVYPSPDTPHLDTGGSQGGTGGYAFRYFFKSLRC